MLDLDRRLAERHPRWFRGRRGRIARPLLRRIGRMAGLDAAAAFLSANTHLQGLAFVDAAIAHLGVAYDVDPAALARVPPSGGVLVVANHPAGALDALALLQSLGRIRRDVRIVANDWLSAIPNLASLLLPVRVLGGRAGEGSLRAIRRALEAGACVVVFPAGEVSRLGLAGVRDARWRRGFVRFAAGTGVPVLPVRVHARNSALFYGMSLVSRPAGTLLLAREMFAGRGRRLALSIGTPEVLPADEPADDALRRIRRALYRLRRPASRGCGAPAPLAPPADRAALRSQVEGLRLLGATGDGKQIRVGQVAVGTALSRELGRERERTFRAVGEGSGRAMDLDAYDGWYEQIVLWDPGAGRIAGGYRVARGAAVLARQGMAGLYTASLFEYAEDALPRIAAGLELGRSFVVPEDWGSRSIDYLWQGIGAYLREHPRVRYLFGAVSISAALPPAAREQIAAYYARFHGVDGLARSRRPFAFANGAGAFDDLDADTAFGVLKDNLAALGARVPMLYRQYMELCEPGGARFLAFGVDPDFSDAVDGLIEVDLARMRVHKRARYLADAPLAMPGDAA